jgi:G3E family GTPase
VGGGGPTARRARGSWRPIRRASRHHLICGEMSASGSDEEEAPPALVPLGAAPPPTAAAPAPAAPAARPPPAPVLLLTGYLGAGKTTLVNHLLTARHGYRVAVLLNEAGDSADVERALVREPGGGAPAALADWVELANGCICCSAKGNMIVALEALVGQRARFDYVVIETTGLADPGPVAAALWADPALEAGVALDAVATVVDARHARRQLAERRARGAPAEAARQVAHADVVLLNKCDLVGAAELDAVEAAVRRVNAGVRVLRCERCAVDVGAVLHVGAYAGGARAIAGLESTPDDDGGDDGHEHGDHAHGEHGEHAHGAACAAGACGHPAHGHAAGVRTVAVVLDRPFAALEPVRRWLDDLLWAEPEEEEAQGEEGVKEEGAGASAGELDAADGGEDGDGAAADAPWRPRGGLEILRIKGLLWLAGEPRARVVQAVQALYDVTEGPAWAALAAAERPLPRASKLVFIGRGLERAALAAGLEALCCDAAE